MLESNKCYLWRGHDFICHSLCSEHVHGTHASEISFRYRTYHMLGDTNYIFPQIGVVQELPVASLSRIVGSEMHSVKNSFLFIFNVYILQMNAKNV